MSRARSHRVAALVLAGAVAASACASSPRATGLQTLVGCWRFERDEAARELRLPWGVRFLDRRLEGWPAMEGLEDVRAAATLTDSTRARDYPFGYWRLTAAGDSIRIGYPGGGGLVADLAIERGADGDTGNGLHGAVRGVGDVVPLDSPIEADVARPVLLTRVSCADGDPGTAREADDTTRTRIEIGRSER